MEGNSAMGRKGNTNKGTGRQGKHKQSNGRQKGTWCGNTEGRGKGLEENNKQNKKSHDVSRCVTKIRDVTLFNIFNSYKTRIQLFITIYINQTKLTPSQCIQIIMDLLAFSL